MITTDHLVRRITVRVLPVDGPLVRRSAFYMSLALDLHVSNANANANRNRNTCVKIYTSAEL